MVDPHTWLAFAGAAALLMLIPGPNVALIVASSVAQGAGRGMVSVLGTVFGMAVQVAAITLGIAGLRGGPWLAAVQVAGVVYLIWLGVAQWRAGQPAPGAGAAGTSFRRAALVSLTNPKVLVFYGAFFPQFLVADRPLAGQVAVLSATFLALAFGVDSLWCLLASRVRPLLAGGGRLAQRCGGGILVAAGVALALVHLH